MEPYLQRRAAAIGRTKPSDLPMRQPCLQAVCRSSLPRAKTADKRLDLCHVAAIPQHSARYSTLLKPRRLTRIIPTHHIVLQRDIEQDTVDIRAFDLPPKPSVTVGGWLNPGTHLIQKVLLKDRHSR